MDLTFGHLEVEGIEREGGAESLRDRAHVQDVWHLDLSDSRNVLNLSPVVGAIRAAVPSIG